MKDHDLSENNRNVECRRCGTCCRKGGPALHGEDRSLIDDGSLKLRQLVAVRYLEPAHDPITNNIQPSRSEFLKIMGKGNSWTCIFYRQDENGCSIYRNRPLECRLLFCRDTAPLEAVLWEDMLKRADLLPSVDPVLSLIRQLDEDCPYEQVNDLLADLKGKPVEVLDKLTDLVRRDLVIREEFLRRFPEREQDELFLFGRPLFLVLAPYGFMISEGPGGVVLRMINPSH